MKTNSTLKIFIGSILSSIKEKRSFKINEMANIFVISINVILIFLANIKHP